MLLPTSVTNRRKFLERTALGAGSVLFLPGLLTSCADHRIPEPSTPGVIPPVVGADYTDWNDQAKTFVVAGLSMIPEVGGILSGLLSIFWPGTDVWSQVRDRVESLIDQKLSDQVNLQVNDDLEGLQSSLNLYLLELKNGNSVSILTQWIATRNSFAEALPHFQSEGYETVLLGLFAQFANMYLSLLRDAVINGKSWGRSVGDQQQDIKDLQTSISDFSTYTQTTCTDYLNSLPSKGPNEPFASRNHFTREITLAALDYMNTWVFYDITKYPKGAPKILFPRELYSDPQGTINSDFGPLQLPSPPTQSPIHITVWGADEGIKAVQLTYPTGSGPGGVTTTPRMGVQDGSGSTNFPSGDDFDINSNDPIVQVSTGLYTSRIDNFVYGMQFQFYDGYSRGAMGGWDHSGDRAQGPWAGIPDHFMSSIYIHGSTSGANYYEVVADCVIYGFKYLNGGPSVTSRTLGLLYVTNPRELSGADFAQAFPTYGVADALITDNLKAARQAYWAAIAQAKAPK